MTRPLITPGKPRDRVQARLPKNQIYEAPPGTPLAHICRAARIEAVAAVLNGRLAELSQPLLADAEVTPIPLTHPDGARIYRRSLVFLLVAAARQVFPHAEILIQHSAASAGGYFCEVRGRAPFRQSDLDLIAARMRELVQADVPFQREAFTREQAMALFNTIGEPDTARLLQHRVKPLVPLYRLEDHWDFAQGFVVPSTGYLKLFALHAYSSGFLLQFPRQDNPNRLGPITAYPKLFAVYQQAGDWLDKLGIRNVGLLNQAIESGRLPEISLVAEALHAGSLARIAEDIAAQRHRVKVVLIAGPSSSGKTTFAKRLAVQLLTHGIRPFIISLDDYFVNREDTPRDAEGHFDFERLEAVDVALFNTQLLALMTGQTVTLPRYNFITGQREVGPVITPRPDNLVIVEGIHGLNPALVPHLPAERLYRVYISALTQLNLDKHNRVSTTDTRLLRRIVRDAATRGYTATDTLRRWESVKRGEKLHIFPFQENSDAMFNSSLVHELSVLRPLVEPLLLQLRPDVPEFLEANRLLSFLAWFKPAPAAVVPAHSLLREFIGGSSLEKFHIWPFD